MCVFCGAIPASMAMGASVQVRQNQQRKEAQALGQEAKKPVVPAGPATALVVAGLLTASIIVHTQLTG